VVSADGSPVVGVVLAVVVVGLAWPPSTRLPADAPRPVHLLNRRMVAGLVAVAAVLFALSGLRLPLVLVLLGGAVGIAGIVRRARGEKEALTRERVVVELAEALVGELRAGQPVQAALERGVELWPEFAPVAAAGRLGADVPTALRRLARSPGASGLDDVAAAWFVSLRSGATLAVALGQVADSARARLSTRHLVAAELSSARATARLVAVLPFASLSMAAGLGGAPWRFLLTDPIGIACLAVGGSLVLGAQFWIDALARRVLMT